MSIPTASQMREVSMKNYETNQMNETELNRIVSCIKESAKKGNFCVDVMIDSECLISYCLGKLIERGYSVTLITKNNTARIDWSTLFNVQ